MQAKHLSIGKLLSFFSYRRHSCPKWKYLPTCLSFLLFLTTANAQTLDWVKGMGGISSDYTQGGIAVDDSGNVYATGYFLSATADFNPGGSAGTLNSAGGYDVFLVKYDAGGNYLWAKNIGGSLDDNGYGVAVSSSGNVYVTGAFRSATVNFDLGGSRDTLTSAGNYDVFFAKYDAGGNCLWAKSIGGSRADYGYSVAVDGSDNIYITGYFAGTADFNPGQGIDTLTSVGSNDVFLAKYDTGGNYVWAKSMGGTGGDIGYSVAADAAGNVYVTGYFNSATADFNPGGSGGTLTTAGSVDVFLVKYDAGGNYLWAKGMGGSKADYGRGVAVDDSSDVYVTGYFSSATADFNPGGSGGTLTNAGNSDVFLAKYDAGGNYLWAKSIGGNKQDRGNGVAVGGNGNVYVTGYFFLTAEFNPGGSGGTLTSAGGYDVFLAKYNTSGNYLWAKSMGGSNDDQGWTVATDGSGNVFGAGYFKATASFDSASGVQLNSNGGTDIYLVKLSGFTSCANGSNLTDTACNSYSFGGVKYTSSGTYRDTLTNAKGCDSIVTLYLTIVDTVRSTIKDVACDNYTFNSTTYTASGSYNQVYTSAQGCDSIVTLNLIINKSYHQTNTQIACDHYVFLGKALSQSGIYSDTLATVTGCDSIITLNLTIQSSDTTLTVQACDNYTLNDSIYTISGTYTQVLTNSSGCDSTITLQLTVGSSPQSAVVQTGTTLTASSADSYQWLDCDNGYAPVAGATGQTFTPDHTGNYAVLITVGSCSDTSDCYKVEITNAINELSGDNKIKLYPNPTTGKVTIKAEQTLQDATIRLLNVMGQVLAKQVKQTGKQFELNMTSYASGIYFVEIEEGESGKMIRMKLVKE